MSDTPRTDRESELGVGPRAVSNGNAVHTDFARQIERELNIATKALEGSYYEAWIKERDKNQ